MSESLDTWKALATRTLDVRPDLARGDEPFVRIMEAAEATRPGEILAVIAPFEPVPLYNVLAERGFTHETRKIAADEWIVHFQSG
ncbi:MAG: DUF2249 domain-containing protein [Ktedonobacteraceae bacterium]|nr:DUF2249 domain-containing protein [Ktedonobacteraceae bacterium]